MKAEYILPQLNLDAFNCPNCRVYTKQRWYYLQASSGSDGYGIHHKDTDFKVSHCEKCKASTIWHQDKIIFPHSAIVPPPNIDLPSDIKNDYNEAATITNLSPKGSAALLRLCIQKLCMHLGEPGKNINDDIKNLVSKGLPPKVQEALDTVRVIGNECVHPGTIDLDDNREVANKLFHMVNFIATKMISEPKEIDELYSSLPTSKIDGIKARDGAK
ncbi:protein of unknown function [Tindallia magadiensis]|uniref:DUF4145 domain-containing protein n=1 Tax=Tindallia magadiensis TaxID=69895 RepID=A0A1I3G4M1_9FIRM|nr:DUF4145 domain-containing protein [Tindallia magadiensis]SFI18423.1 protein of unknown function [Tindallia magadiensis]